MDLLPDILANRFLVQEKEAGKPILGISGHILEKQLELFIPDGASSKMSKDTYQWDSPQLSVIWRKWVIRCRGEYSARLKLVLRTDVKGYSSWATPQTADIRGDVRMPEERSEKANKGGCKNLREQVYWATPEARNSDGYQVANGKIYPRLGNQASAKPTPRTDSGVSRKLGTGGKCLAEEVKKWPTPRQFMHKDTNIDRNKGNLGEKVGGQLSADWVEWLMGWPIFWTSLKPIKEMFWLDWSVDPADDGSIPRTATGVKDRVNRLKAIGNRQVPQVAAMAWNVLA